MQKSTTCHSLSKGPITVYPSLNIVFVKCFKMQKHLTRTRRPKWWIFYCRCIFQCTYISPACLSICTCLRPKLVKHHEIFPVSFHSPITRNKAPENKSRLFRNAHAPSSQNTDESQKNRDSHSLFSTINFLPLSRDFKKEAFYFIPKDRQQPEEEEATSLTPCQGSSIITKDAYHFISTYLLQTVYI